MFIISGWCLWCWNVCVTKKCKVCVTYLGENLDHCKLPKVAQVKKISFVIRHPFASWLVYTNLFKGQSWNVVLQLNHYLMEPIAARVWKRGLGPACRSTRQGRLLVTLFIWFWYGIIRDWTYDLMHPKGVLCYWSSEEEFLALWCLTRDAIVWSIIEHEV